MDTRISITSNGNVAPNKTIVLGKKYENVGDTLTFTIPSQFVGYHHYLVFYMKKVGTFLLPVNNLQFVISTTITKYAGTYNFMFIATENEVVDGDIDGARKVFVSTTMLGLVEDSFLTDPVTEEVMDPNLQILYDELLDLKNDLDDKLLNDYYRGAYYIPSVDELGNISWTRSDGQDILIPGIQNITGPKGDTGGYYIPTQDGTSIVFEKSKEGLVDVDSIDLNPIVAAANKIYLDENLEEVVDTSVDDKIRWIYDKDTKSLYLYVKDGEVENVDEELKASILAQVDEKIQQITNIDFADYEQKMTSVLEKIDKIDDKVDSELGKGLSSNDYTDAEKTKLAGLTNYDDTTLSTAVNSLEGRVTAAETNSSNAAADASEALLGLDNKVDKESGKGLSTNDYTNAEKTKLTNIDLGLYGATIVLEEDTDNYTFVAKLKNSSGEIISTSDTISIPQQSLIVDADYSRETKQMTLTLANGKTTTVDIADMVANLATLADLENYATTEALDNKVDKETGKGLSSNDYTDAEKTKLSSIHYTITSFTIDNDNRTINIVIDSI